MKDNRTLSILLLNALNRSGLQIALPLAGSGVRGVRFLLECNKGIIKSVSFNDKDKRSVTAIRTHLSLNGIKSKYTIFQSDADLFLLNSKGFDYIDIDPFGSPNFFLDSSIKRLARKGILAVTATDTSALCGTYVKACIRKYWARPLRTAIMHEIGIRILIRKIQLIGAQYDKALVPLYSYSKDHYMKVFLRGEKGKNKVDVVLQQHGLFKDAGPMWLGRLWDASLAKKISAFNTDKGLDRFLAIIAEESRINSIGFWHLPSEASKLKLPAMPSREKIIKEIKSGAAITHFAPNSIRSSIGQKELSTILKKFIR